MSPQLSRQAINLRHFEALIDSEIIHPTWLDAYFWQAIKAEVAHLNEIARRHTERERERRQGTLEPATPRRRVDRKKLEV